jgi:hypothetical protein
MAVAFLPSEMWYLSIESPTEPDERPPHSAHVCVMCRVGSPNEALVHSHDFMTFIYISPSTMGIPRDARSHSGKPLN